MIAATHTVIILQCRGRSVSLREGGRSIIECVEVLESVKEECLSVCGGEVLESFKFSLVVIPATSRSCSSPAHAYTSPLPPCFLTRRLAIIFPFSLSLLVSLPLPVPGVN